MARSIISKILVHLFLGAIMPWKIKKNLKTKFRVEKIESNKNTS